MLQRTLRIRLSFTMSKPDLWIGWLFSPWEFRVAKKYLILAISASGRIVQTDTIYKVAFFFKLRHHYKGDVCHKSFPLFGGLPNLLKKYNLWFTDFFPRNWRKYISFSLLSNPEIGRFYEPGAIILVNCCTTYQNDGIVLHQQKIDFGKEITLL